MEIDWRQRKGVERAKQPMWNRYHDDRRSGSLLWAERPLTSQGWKGKLPWSKAYREGSLEVMGTIKEIDKAKSKDYERFTN